jgi:hypothetical protein
MPGAASKTKGMPRASFEFGMESDEFGIDDACLPRAGWDGKVFLSNVTSHDETIDLLRLSHSI